jgi:dihydrofolate synthase/folylpolyglutamate synthase
MGGRLDATNIIRTPILTILASISMDHMEFLGDTLAKIAWNKAGILKKGVPVVSAHQEDEAREVIEAEAAAKGCPAVFVQPQQMDEIVYGLKEQHFTYRGFGPVTLHLAGLHQLENAALALEAAWVLREQGLSLTDETILSGISNTRWKGRFTVIGEQPTVIIDGAHNPDAAARLRTAVEQYFSNCKKYFIFGVFSDKEYDKIIDKTADLAEHIITVETPSNPRALPAPALAEAVRRQNPSVEAANTIAEAVNRAYTLAEPDDVILAFGSLSFLSEVEQAVLLRNNDK